MDYANSGEKGEPYVMLIKTERAARTPRHKNSSAPDYEWLIAGKIRPEEIVNIVPVKEAEDAYKNIKSTQWE
jgi:hypothetical protein